MKPIDVHDNATWPQPWKTRYEFAMAVGALWVAMADAAPSRWVRPLARYLERRAMACFADAHHVTQEVRRLVDWDA
jgi:hypothetical protein